MSQQYQRVEIHPRDTVPFHQLDAPYLSIPVFWILSDHQYTDEELAILNHAPSFDQIRTLHSKNKFQQSESLFDSYIEVKHLEGVTDSVAQSALKLFALHLDLPQPEHIRTGHLYLCSNKELSTLKNKGNPLLHRIRKGASNEDYFKNRFLPETILRPGDHEYSLESIDLNRSEQELLELNRKRLWALNLGELKAIKEHFENQNTFAEREKVGLPDQPTDVEMEVLAQSWSEHCKHKIFGSTFHYQESNLLPGMKKLGELTINNLFKETIKNPTYEIINKRNIDWAISLFSDNAGIVRYDQNIDLCFKVETHNSPSALDPYGGAITGILGVNRDILGCGIGAKPIANTDVFCVADEDRLSVPEINWPTNVLKPQYVLDGIHAGVRDGGNKSGIPTVNGGIFYHDQYAGKPLVYCGTVGVLPQEIAGNPTHLKRQQVGDRIFMVGGRIGKDGIHGATFSSVELTDDIPPSVVQLGDPFTQKKVMDFLLKARDLNLYTSVTDNGAGGLSSSVGEMALETGGAKIDVALAPTKYPGLLPYELVISESQERMTIAVSPDKAAEFTQLAQRYEVEATDLGEFTDSGHFTIYYGTHCIAHLCLRFLHDEFIPYRINAQFRPGQLFAHYWHGQDFKANYSKNLSIEKSLFTLQKNKNLKSKEHYIRAYDQEVQGSNWLKPYGGPEQSTPNNANVLSLDLYGGEKGNAIVISNGMQPLIGIDDPYLMAIWSVDEAVRNAIAVGADLDFMSILDNFCWPDPIEGPENPDASIKAAALVRTCIGLKDICHAYGLPLISGKDSMKNDVIAQFSKGEKKKISALPTLLVSAISKHINSKQIISTDLKQAGDHLALISAYKPNDWSKDFFRSQFSETYDVTTCLPPLPDLQTHKTMYQQLSVLIKEGNIQSCHDIAEGGLLFCLLEKALGTGLGFAITLDQLLAPNGECDSNVFLYNEISGSFLISYQAAKQETIQKTLGDRFYPLGKVCESNQARITHNDQTLLDLPIHQTHLGERS